MERRWLIPLMLLAAPAFAKAQGTMSADEGWTAVGRCAASGSERERHRCLDDLLRRAGLLTREAEAQAQRREFGARPATPPAASTAAPAPAAPAVKTAPATVPPPSPDRLEVKVATIGVGTDRKVVLTTSDGATWKQTDSDTLPRLPGAGETVRIRKASFGSYLCELPSHHTFRCVRTR